MFKDFLEKNGSRGGGRDGFPVTEDILKEPIESLISSLKDLKEQRMGIVRRELEVSEVLRQTQVVHAEAKKEYNSALAHTSVVYPEVSVFRSLQHKAKPYLSLLVDSDHRSARKLQGSIPAPMGHWYGCINVHLGLHHTLLEKLRSINR